MPLLSNIMLPFGNIFELSLIMKTLCKKTKKFWEDNLNQIAFVALNYDYLRDPITYSASFSKIKKSK